MDRQDIIKRLSAFIENETRSCSMAAMAEIKFPGR